MEFHQLSNGENAVMVVKVNEIKVDNTCKITDKGT